MNYKQLEAFQATMASGSTIAAAEQLGLSQSGISRMLSQLEEDLGLMLFERQKGRLVPTKEAEALLQDATGMIEGAQFFRRHAEQLRVGGFKRKLLKVVVPNTLSTPLMPVVVQNFVAEHSDVMIELLSGTYNHAERLVLSREADLALVGMPTQFSGLRLTPCLDTSAVCVMPAGHALERLEFVTPADLENVPMVLLGRQRFLRHEIDMSFRRARLSPRVTTETHSVNVACSFVAQGLGVSIVNALLAGYCHVEQLTTRPFRPVISYRLGFATLDGLPPNPLHDAFARHLVDGIVASAPRENYTLLYGQTQ